MFNNIEEIIEDCLMWYVMWMDLTERESKKKLRSRLVNRIECLYKRRLSIETAWMHASERNW